MLPNIEQKTTVNAGIPVLSLLGATMVVLKLLGYIDISWWFVLMPFWIIPAVFLGILGFGAVVIVIVAVIQHYNNRK